MSTVTWYQAIAYDVAASDYASLAWSRKRSDAEFRGKKYMYGWIANMNNKARSREMMRSFEVVSYDIVIDEQTAV